MNLEVTEKLRKTVQVIDHQYTKLSDCDKIKDIVACIGFHGGMGNPLFAARVEACRKEL